MIRLFIYFSLLVFAGDVFAQNTVGEVLAPVPAAEAVDLLPAKFRFKVGLGYQARIEKAAGGSERTETLESPSIFTQVDYLEYELHAEIEQVKKDTAEGNYSIRSTRLEGLLIGRYRFSLDPQWLLFGGLGAGLAKETVQTSIGSSSAQHTGDTERIGVLEAGVQYDFHEKFFGEVSARGLKLENLEPWIITMGIRLGARL